MSVPDVALVFVALGSTAAVIGLSVRDRRPRAGSVLLWFAIFAITAACVLLVV